MLLWILFAILTAGVIGAISRSLLRGEVEASDGSASIAVYRDQMKEIEREVARGVSTSEEAEAVRIELSRRMLRAADARLDDATADGGDGTRRGRIVALGAAAGVPVLAIAAYLAIGSPSLPSLPHAERVAAADAAKKSVEDLVGLVEQRLRADPNDGQGWNVIAPVYLRQQRYTDAMRAFGNALRLLGENEARLAGFAEAAVLANDGIVVPAARKAYERLQQINPDRPEPAFWLALGKQQDGDTAGAITLLDALLAKAPSDAPWRALVEERLAALRGGADATAAGPQKRSEAEHETQPSRADAVADAQGPSASDMEAAAKMSPTDRAKMIEDMVQRLATRLEGNGKDLEGWQRLAKAYKVLGRDAEARAALARARANFPGDEQAVRRLDDLARELGLGS